jgi:hypothetical protein
MAETTTARRRARIGGALSLRITRRGLQIALGLIWLLDGGLQFQSAFYSHAFTDGLREQAAGQPIWLAHSITWAANLAADNLGVWNTLFALTQVLIGLGLLYRPTVKPALAASFAWVLFVWWFGEAFGMLFVNMAEPLTGAPGGVLLYALVGVLIWPSERAGGLLSARGARIMWAALWLVMAWLWLGPASSGPDSLSDVLEAGGSGMGWLTSVQQWVAGWTAGGGLVIAIVFAVLSAAIAIGVGADRGARPLLWISIAMNLLLWVLGQSVGELFAGGATDPNAGPLFILLALAMLPIVDTARLVDAPDGIYDIRLRPRHRRARVGRPSDEAGVAWAELFDQP